MTTRPRLCVYCGARAGVGPAFVDAARRFGQVLAQRGCDLVYGGGRVGLMGQVADAALAHGASVIGVIPESLMRREVGHPGLTELQVVPDMHQRKRLMAERADAFVALPGGIGTFEELFEAWTWRHLGYHSRPLGLLDTGGYYQPLVAFLNSARDQGFLDDQQLAMVESHAEPEELIDRLLAQMHRSSGPDNYSRI
ncbi:MAG: TIGR00730 family Rossman fold protein [Aquabacterium sp.]